MNVIGASDRLESLGVVVGGLLVLVGLATIVSMPWATNNSVLVSIIQLVGIVAMMALGVGLVRLSYVDD